jgi:hypothetical protein
VVTVETVLLVVQGEQVRTVETVQPVLEDVVEVEVRVEVEVGAVQRAEPAVMAVLEVKGQTE